LDAPNRLLRPVAMPDEPRQVTAPRSRSTLLAIRRERIAAALPLVEAILLVGAGVPIPLPENRDQTDPFRSHAEYFHLTGGYGTIVGSGPNAEVLHFEPTARAVQSGEAARPSGWICHWLPATW